MKASFIFFTIFLSTVLSAQDAQWVFFTDKGETSISEIEKNNWLSEKSLQRRKIQAIPLEESDLPVHKAYIEAVLAEGGKLRHVSRWLNAVSIEGLTPNQLNTIEKFFFVKSTRPVAQLQLAMSVDVPAQYKWFDYGDGHDQIQQVNGIALHQLGYLGGGKTIAVIDGGFVNSQLIGGLSKMRDDGRLLTTYNFVNGDTNVFVSGGHGTAVLSVMAAEIDGSLVGTAPEANYMLLTSEDDNNENLSEEDNWVAAAEFADSAGAEVINSSLGYTTFDGNIGNHTYADMNGRTTVVTLGAVFAHRKGMVVCVAAGNEGQSSWGHISAPADADSILSIGAVDAVGTYAPFTSYGPTSDGRLKPDVSARGVQTAYFTTSDFVSASNGTSLATPVITGMAACLWQARPFATNYEIMEAIRKSAHQYNNPDYYIGYGIPNFYSAMLSIGVEENEWNSVSVYPNPSSDQIHIDLQEGLNTIAIVSMSGQLMYYAEKIDGTMTSLDVNHFAEGQYVVRVRNGNQLKSSVISIVH